MREKKDISQEKGGKEMISTFYNRNREKVKIDIYKRSDGLYYAIKADGEYGPNEPMILAEARTEKACRKALEKKGYLSVRDRFVRS